MTGAALGFLGAAALRAGAARGRQPQRAGKDEQAHAPSGCIASASAARADAAPATQELRARLDRRRSACAAGSVADSP
jgi:hypothetical protein